MNFPNPLASTTPCINVALTLVLAVAVAVVVAGALAVVIVVAAVVVAVAGAFFTVDDLIRMSQVHLTIPFSVLSKRWFFIGGVRVAAMKLFLLINYKKK